MSLQQQQLDFTRWIRDPQSSLPIEDVAVERMELYRELFFNNILDTLSNAFPVLHGVIDEQHWLQLCQRFFAQHQCHTPYLSHVPGEFVAYLEQQQNLQPAWMLELAQWEWSELELFLATDPQPREQLGDDVIHGIPVLSSLIRLHQCRYPVHRIGANFIPEEPAEQPLYLLAWRKADDSVGFMQINGLSAVIMQMMRDNQRQQQPCSGHQLLRRIAAQQKVHELSIIIDGGIEFLQHLYNNSIIIGSLNAPLKETSP
jgi:hypothetical protein